MAGRIVLGLIALLLGLALCFVAMSFLHTAASSPQEIQAAADGSGGGGARASAFTAAASGVNNCLFDAVRAKLAAAPLSAVPPFATQETDDDIAKMGSVSLRDACNKRLTETGMPLIPDGLPAGEQYLAALSAICKAALLVTYSADGGRQHLVCDGEFLDALSPELKTRRVISIVHTGAQLAGHWVPAPS